MTQFNPKLLLLAGAALALFASAPAFAQATSAAPAAKPQSISRAQLSQQLDGEFKELDGNKDGKLTAAEIQAAMTARAGEAQAQINKQAKEVFDKIDTNHNGQISLAEFQAQEKLSVDPAKVQARVTQLDTNKDGSISVEEYRNGTLVQFDKADANHDGTVSAAEAGGGR